MQASWVRGSCVVFDEVKGDVVARVWPAKGRTAWQRENVFLFCRSLYHSNSMIPLVPSPLTSASHSLFINCLTSFFGHCVVQSYSIYAIFSCRPISDHWYRVLPITFGSRREAKVYSQSLLPSSVPTTPVHITAFRVSLALHHASKCTFLPDKTHFLKCSKVSLTVSLKHRWQRWETCLSKQRTHTFVYPCSRWSKHMLCFYIDADLPETLLCPTHCCF